MENASKALLIAGAMLLLILVLTFSVYLVRRIGGQTSELYSDMEQSKIDEFNQKFFNYDGRGTKKDSEGKWINPLTIQDVVSIINLAKDNNQNGRFKNLENYNNENTRFHVIIKVKVDGVEKQNTSNDEIKEMLSNQDNINAKYSCKVEYGENKNLVENITIEKLS
ncbi:MAG: hypothetical protein ILA02_04610 [Clostridia bacterium]|nr:hypothetical protein [Clostridia bacterium]